MLRKSIFVPMIVTGVAAIGSSLRPPDNTTWSSLPISAKEPNA
jgi:hypothetical protein